LLRGPLGFEGGGQFMMARESWASARFPRHLFARYEIGALARGRPAVTPHSKIMCPVLRGNASADGAAAPAAPFPSASASSRASASAAALTPKERAGSGLLDVPLAAGVTLARQWSFVGSANGSSSALGMLCNGKTGPTLVMRNWELGVLLPPVLRIDVPVAALRARPRSPDMLSRRAASAGAAASSSTGAQEPADHEFAGLTLGDLGLPEYLVRALAAFDVRVSTTPPPLPYVFRIPATPYSGGDAPWTATDMAECMAEHERKLRVAGGATAAALTDEQVALLLAAEGEGIC
jgi:hypothetical protein